MPFQLQSFYVLPDGQMLAKGFMDGYSWRFFDFVLMRGVAPQVRVGKDST